MIKPMIKATNQSPMTTEQAEELKFKLYLNNRKVTELAKIMDTILLWPKQTRKQWAKKFSPEVSNLLDEMLEDAVDIFDGATLDQELMGLFAEYTENLKNVTKHVEGVIASHRPIDA